MGVGRLATGATDVLQPVLHTITVRLDNVTDELYRNHLSLIKDLAPEMGRNFKLLYNMKF